MIFILEIIVALVTCLCISLLIAILAGLTGTDYYQAAVNAGITFISLKYANNLIKKVSSKVYKRNGN